MGGYISQFRMKPRVDIMTNILSLDFMLISERHLQTTYRSKQNQQIKTITDYPICNKSPFIAPCLWPSLVQTTSPHSQEDSDNSNSVSVKKKLDTPCWLV